MYGMRLGAAQCYGMLTAPLSEWICNCARTRLMLAVRRVNAPNWYMLLASLHIHALTNFYKLVCL